MNARAREYARDIQSLFTNAIDNALTRIGQRLQQINPPSDAERVAVTVIAELLRTWDQDFVNNISEIANPIILRTYNFFRRDQTIFPEGTEFSRQSFQEIPDAVFNLTDFRTIAHLQNLDDVFMGQFITDADTRRRIRNFLIENFIEGNVPIGPDSPGIDLFLSRFGEFVNNEGFKARRIIETTLNQARNFGSLNYMDQLGITRYRILELNDNRTCPYCRFMNGKVLDIGPARRQMLEFIEAGADGNRIRQIKPFAPTVPLEEFRSLTNEQLQAMGFNVPSFHPHCRGRTVAEIV